MTFIINESLIMTNEINITLITMELSNFKIDVQIITASKLLRN